MECNIFKEEETPDFGEFSGNAQEINIDIKIEPPNVEHYDESFQGENRNIGVEKLCFEEFDRSTHDKIINARKLNPEISNNFKTTIIYINISTCQQS